MTDASGMTSAEWEAYFAASQERLSQAMGAAVLRYRAEAAAAEGRPVSALTRAAVVPMVKDGMPEWHLRAW